MQAEPRRLHITVVYAAAPRQVREWLVALEAGAAVRDALNHVEIAPFLANVDLSEGHVGVWGRKAEGGRLLRDGDRVEIYRPLLVDPKVARRERFASQGARGAGLFAKKRAGAKAGY